MRYEMSLRRPGLWMQAGFRRYGSSEALATIYQWVAWFGPLRLKAKKKQTDDR